MQTQPQSKKRKRKERERPLDPPPPSLAERLEALMDKLAMWQLMQTIDGAQARSGAARVLPGKGKDKDERDWMQIFCEDIVEPLYVPRPPAHPLTSPSAACARVHATD